MKVWELVELLNACPRENEVQFEVENETQWRDTYVRVGKISNFDVLGGVTEIELDNGV